MNTDRFKFRIWHDQQGMIYPDGIFIRVSQDKIMKLDPTIEEPRYFIMPLQDYDLMQCTGLKDVEGNLIYEGDLIDCGGFNRSIRWENGRFVAVHIDEDYVDCLEYNMKTIKVIGNIYEGTY